MTDSDSDKRLREEIVLLRAQNRRYRELIQSLSSTTEVLRAHLKDTQPKPPELRAFERFGQRQRPTAELATGSPGKKESIHPTGQNPEQETKEGLKSLVPTPGWKCLAVDQPQIRIGFLLFGMTPESVEEAVEAVEQRQVRSRDFSPVFVTDNPDLAPFRDRGYVVEYVPLSITSNRKKNRAHRHDLQGRLELIEAKWDLDNLVDLGRSPQTRETS
jgi:hypothetical protein